MVTEKEALTALLEACKECGLDGARMFAELRAVAVPKEPPPGLLMSMAIRFDHGLGMPGYYDAAPFRRPGQPSHTQRLEATLRTMRQLYEEVSGHGFYRPEREAEYAAMADSKAHNAKLTGPSDNQRSNA